MSFGPGGALDTTLPAGPSEGISAQAREKDARLWSHARHLREFFSCCVPVSPGTSCQNGLVPPTRCAAVSAGDVPPVFLRRCGKPDLRPMTMLAARVYP
jgi:hypothetical protein